MFKCFHHCVIKVIFFKKFKLFFYIHIYSILYRFFNTFYIYQTTSFYISKITIIFNQFPTPYCNNININLYTNYYINYYITIILNIVNLQRLQSNKIQNVALSLFEHRIFY